MSTHINAANKGDIAENILLPGDPLRAKFIAENYLENPIQYNDIRNMYGFTGRYKGTPVSVQGTGMGSPSIGIYTWELITEYGAQNLIRVGTAGSFKEEVKLFDAVMAISASTDSNYIHAFDAHNGYAPCASWDLLTKAYEVNKEQQLLDLKAGNMVTCDVFYETADDWWKKWAKMNVLGVEMEAAALYMNAAYHNVNALAMVLITDHFVTGERATTKQREEGNDSLIKLALEVAIK